ncbi:hypothetical protein ACFQ1M_03270 [Sungkyunkwania multivorans]|uniref:Uncharacterized protein n=1 Tax=Sungkyunkwania multivorans TaxID=1173618 RepID=A0ABW3CTW9_9FLAO
MIRKMFLGAIAIGMFAASCSNDDDGPAPIVAEAGTLTGGPFTFVVDGTPDNVSGITTDPAAVGANSTFVITDDQNNILGLPPNIEALEAVDFDDAGAGVCLIWYLRYEGTISGAEMGMNAGDLEGNFDLSNSITVTRQGQANAGTIAGGPFTFTVDGTADNVSGITQDLTNASGSSSTWVITDDTGNILGLPPTLADVEGVNFDDAGAGVCLIWYLRYEGEITGAAMGMNANNIQGNFDLSNSITVTRNLPAEAGTISGGPFTFVVDGTVDNVSGITQDLSNASGSNSTWVITDDAGNILGLPPTLADVEGVNFDDAGAGVCLIWYLRYEGEITGAEMGMNASGIQGNFDLSNAITVTRNVAANAGTIAGGPFTFTVDGTVDNVSGITQDLTNASGSSSTWVITDDAGNILGLPPTLAAVEGVDFDGAGVGVCLIWYLRYEGEITGAEMGMNASGIQGNFDLSNSITVTRNAMAEAGTISGGPFTFTVDGTPDNVSGITQDLTNASGSSSTWVITDDAGNILGLPPTLAAVEGVDFDAAGAGVCLIWHLRYEGEIMGAEMGMNASGIQGNFDLSNSITVTRN